MVQGAYVSLLPAENVPLKLTFYFRWIGYSGSYLTLPFLAFYSLFIWTVLSYLQRFILKLLLHYKGFMFEPRG